MTDNYNKDDKVYIATFKMSECKCDKCGKPVSGKILAPISTFIVKAIDENYFRLNGMQDPVMVHHIHPTEELAKKSGEWLVNYGSCSCGHSKVEVM